MLHPNRLWGIHGQQKLVCAPLMDGFKINGEAIGSWQVWILLPTWP